MGVVARVRARARARGGWTGGGELEGVGVGIGSMVTAAILARRQQGGCKGMVVALAAIAQQG